MALRKLSSIILSQNNFPFSTFTLQPKWHLQRASVALVVVLLGY